MPSLLRNLTEKLLLLYKISYISEPKCNWIKLFKGGWSSCFACLENKGQLFHKLLFSIHGNPFLSWPNLSLLSMFMALNYLDLSSHVWFFNFTKILWKVKKQNKILSHHHLIFRFHQIYMFHPKSFELMIINPYTGSAMVAFSYQEWVGSRDLQGYIWTLSW